MADSDQIVENGYVDVDESRDTPCRHRSRARRLRGRYTTRFSFYFPPDGGRRRPFLPVPRGFQSVASMARRVVIDSRLPPREAGRRVGTAPRRPAPAPSRRRGPRRPTLARARGNPPHCSLTTREVPRDR